MFTAMLVLAALAAQTVGTTNGTAKTLTPDPHEDDIPVVT